MHESNGIQIEKKAVKFGLRRKGEILSVSRIISRSFSEIKLFDFYFDTYFNKTKPAAKNIFSNLLN